ncbi:hypothetical protein BKA61DRAFT_478246, partial [Leptodontidium sp. MPI-SDFR-AT-0119]
TITYTTNIYLAFNRDKFDVEPRKVLWIASFLRDTTAHWIKLAVSDYLINYMPTRNYFTVIAEKSKIIFRTVAGFTTTIKGVFGDPNKTK